MLSLRVQSSLTVGKHVFMSHPSPTLQGEAGPPGVPGPEGPMGIQGPDVCEGVMCAWCACVSACLCVVCENVCMAQCVGVHTCEGVP